MELYQIINKLFETHDKIGLIYEEYDENDYAQFISSRPNTDKSHGNYNTVTFKLHEKDCVIYDVRSSKLPCPEVTDNEVRVIETDGVWTVKGAGKEVPL